MYALAPSRPQEVVVEATMDGQQIVNKFYLKAGVGTVGGTSDVLLANFRDNFRNTFLSQLYDRYRVQQYVMREIRDVQAVVAGPPARWKNVYTASGRDVLAGVHPNDSGVKTLVALQAHLPAHEAIRIKKKPLNYYVKYFKGNYNRFTSWTTSEKDGTSPERWLAAAITALNGQLTVFNGLAMWSVLPAAEPWYHGLWSPQFYGNEVKPIGGGIQSAVVFCDQLTASPFIGTQITRRFTSIGTFTGK